MSVASHIGSGFDREVLSELIKAAKDLKDINIKVGAINVYENKRKSVIVAISSSTPTLIAGLTDKFGLTSFPTITL